MIRLVLAGLCLLAGCCSGNDVTMEATGVAESIYFDREYHSYVSIFKTENERIVLYTEFEQPNDWGQIEIGEMYHIVFEGQELISANPVKLEDDAVQ